MSQDGPRPQGCKVKAYLAGGKTEEYELHSIKYELLPTGVAICTFNTPKNLNALTFNQQWETFLVLEHMKYDENVKVAIWTGCGDRAFNSGADLKGDFKIYVPEHIQQFYLTKKMGPERGDFALSNETRAFWDFPKPSICAVNGLAVGGAANIALMNFHDIVICSTKARFMYPFPKLGFTPELSSSFMLPRLVGFAKAKELFFLSPWFSAEDALRLGLCNRVVKPEELMSEALKIAESLVLLHPEALAQAKKVVNYHVRKDLDNILAVEQEHISASMAATGGPLGIGQFMAERKEWLEKVKSKM